MPWMRLLVLMLWLSFGAGPVLAQEAGTMLKEDVLRAEPYADAQVALSLKKGAAVTILKRTGGWYQVKAGATQGWVRMLSVRRGGASQTNAMKEASGAAAIATGRAGTGQVVSTTGVRGLSEADLKAAKYDEAQIKKAESFAVAAAVAQTFAQQGKLKAMQFDYLPAPAQTESSQAGRR
jgi:uncharacterized protein YgiM (DUF1202 family)